MEPSQELSSSVLLPSLKRKTKNPASSSSSSPLDDDSTVVFDPSITMKRLKSEPDRRHHGDDDDGVVVVKSAVPVGFLDPLGPKEREILDQQINGSSANNNNIIKTRKQFWKAGDYEASKVGDHHAYASYYPGGMDHVRVHPRFLHSNATSHKWVLGAFAELLDNSLDEVCNGATRVSIDMIYNKKERGKMLLSDQDRNKMLLVEDNGGGMNPEKMRQCMSLGYSAKSKMANTIGQYGNGFKTSTMRLGADVIVFSMCQGKDGKCATRSIGLLSYTFLTSTGKEDIIVPMIDYEAKGNFWTKMLSSSLDDWNKKLEIILEWSPFASEQELLCQFNSLGKQGTKIIIYNLWEDDENQLELDFGSDPQDIQIRGVNRDEKKIAMARKYPNSKHFLTYQHSLRSYASILYLRLPPGFRMILRGKDVEHHNLVNDMILQKQHVYKPVAITDGTVKGSIASSEDMQASVTIGFAKDAMDHMDIQGFNVYHKNRLIKPFWRVWNAAGSDGRGVIGVLEANFVEPAHDKQGFEKTTALSRLENRLNDLQKSYWRDNCHEIGYAPRRSMNKVAMVSPISSSKGNSSKKTGNRTEDSDWETPKNTRKNSVKKSDQSLPVVESSSDEEMIYCDDKSQPQNSQCYRPPSIKEEQLSDFKAEIEKIKKENLELQIRLDDVTEARDHWLEELQLERQKCQSLEAELEKVKKKAAEDSILTESVVKMYDELNEQREKDRERLRAASDTIDKLFARVEELSRTRIIVQPEHLNSQKLKT